LARKIDVIGFDINEKRVDMMRNNIDPSDELDASDFEGCSIKFTSSIEDLKEATFFIVAVPTPIDNSRLPDLKPLIGASTTVGKALKKGDYVVYESTVYPGCTEEDCIPVLEEVSGLKFLTDFKVGYSPERINPGDKARPLTKILKIVSGCDEESLEEIASVYDSIIEPGIYKAPTIKVAEAAKIIENTQRDLNISLMNELSMIFDIMDIDTKEVLKAAGTKWNFLKFFPGLVGGHCIGVDPYYLVHKSKKVGYDPQVILSGRRINDQMPAFIAKRLIQMLIQRGKNPQETKVLVKGITFKEDVTDIRNSKVADLIQEIANYSIKVHVEDPFASAEEVNHEYGLHLTDQLDSDYDAIVVAVGHAQFKELSIAELKSLMKKPGILFDLKGIYPKNEEIIYWRL